MAGPAVEAPIHHCPGGSAGVDQPPAEPGCDTIFLANDSGTAQAVSLTWHGVGSLSVWNPQTGGSEHSASPVAQDLGPYEGRIIRIETSP